MSDDTKESPPLMPDAFMRRAALAEERKTQEQKNAALAAEAAEKLVGSVYRTSSEEDRVSSAQQDLRASVRDYLTYKANGGMTGTRARLAGKTAIPFGGKFVLVSPGAKETK